MHVSLPNSIPLFASLTEEEKIDLAKRITVREFPPQHTIFWLGDKGDDFYIISSGKIAILCPDGDAREVTLAVLGPGDFLGEVSLLDGGPRTATARTQSEVSVLCLGHEAFGEFVRECPSAALHIMSTLGRRQRDIVDRLRGIRNLNEVMEEQVTPWQRISHNIAALAASPKFLATHAIAFTGWMLLNAMLGRRAPDPFPFPFLCLWASGEAIFLSMFIMISQNLQSQKDRLRTELEYQVAMKAQMEIMQLHRKIDELSAKLSEVGQPATASS